MNAATRLARLASGLSRDKSDTLLLLGSALLVLAPHAAHLPFWVSALCTVTLVWRATVTFRGTRMPPSLLLVPMAFAAMGGIYLTFSTVLGREAGVAMLVMLVAFKMLEMRARRDLFVVIFLCYFLLLTNFFYSQSIGTALMMVASVLGLLTAQISFQFTGAVPPLRTRIGMGLKILALAAPLALALFVFFPRIQGPLWGLPGDARSGSSGMSKSMSPGNISRLALSDEVAFRAKFDSFVPRPYQLYWRGLVLADFDGRTWTQAVRTSGERRPRLPVTLVDPGVSYAVTLEPHNERWVYALDLPAGAPEVSGNLSGISSEAEILTLNPISQRLRYSARSHLNYQLQQDELPDRERWVALPQGFNPRAMQEGLDLQRTSDPAQRVAALLRRFARGGFTYTLEPPALGVNSVDEFMYQTKRGFCEHYSSAFVFMMRAADVPARVVVGYQGGQMNPVDGYMTVRQLDAHAWAEVWIAQRGWVRVDPTAAVAPDRIQQQSTRAAPPQSFGMQTLGSLIKLDENSWLAQLRFRISAINNSWNQWVLNYTPERQQGFLETLKSMFVNWRTAGAVVLLAVLLAVARVLHLRSEKDPVDALYSALCLQLGRLGIVRASDEGPSALAARVGAFDMAPERQAAIVRFLQLYSLHKYGPAAPDPGLVPTLKKLLLNSQ
ncbi:MAG: DUF3488 and transglutaminase-like domain-containing protein [Pseudomonadota bacterium]